MLTAALFAIFAQVRSGPQNAYTAVWVEDVSSLKEGDSVRVAGVQVSTVNRVRLEPDNSVTVGFGADRDIVLTEGTKAAVRYLNLVGDCIWNSHRRAQDRVRIQPPGSVIPGCAQRAALDLDLLLGGSNPLLRGWRPQAVNALTNSQIQILQGQDGNRVVVRQDLGAANSLADNGDRPAADRQPQLGAGDHRADGDSSPPPWTSWRNW